MTTMMTCGACGSWACVTWSHGLWFCLPCAHRFWLQQYGYALKGG